MLLSFFYLLFYIIYRYHPWCERVFILFILCVCAGTLLEINENNGMRREDNQAKKDSTEVKVQLEPKLQIKRTRESTSSVTSSSDLSQRHEQTQKMNKPENKNQGDILIPAASSMVASIAASLVTQRISGVSPPKAEAQDDRKVSLTKTKAPKMTPASASVTTAVLPNTVGLKHTETVNVTLPNHSIPKTTGVVAPAKPPSLVPNNPPKLTLIEAPTDSTQTQKLPKTTLVLPAATPQSSGKSSINTPTTKMTMSQDAALFPPSHKPPKLVGLNVTTATKEASSLRQVHSCPNSLQR